jgi:hypothetical protein
MVLFKPIVEISVGPMSDRLTQVTADRRRVGVMSIGGDAIRYGAGHGSGRPKERLGGGKVAVLAEHHIDQSAISVDGSI